MTVERSGNGLRPDLPMSSDDRAFFRPWLTDATSLVADGRGPGKEKIRHLFLVRPKGVQDFETVGTLFVAGDRGTGKSSVLLKKAATFLAENDPKTYKTLRSSPPYINELLPQKIQVPRQNYRALSSHRIWEKYWQLTLLAHFSVMTLRQRNVMNSGDVVKVVKEHYGFEPSGKRDESGLTPYAFFESIWLNSGGLKESITPSMADLVQNGVSLEDANVWIKSAEKVLSHSLDADQEIFFSIFVDAIDEAIGSPDGRSLFLSVFDVRDHAEQITRNGEQGQDFLDPNSELRQLSAKIWLHSQTGFMLAAAGIARQFSGRFLTYGSVRREAGEWLKNPTNSGLSSQKLAGNQIAFLSYEKEHLKDIFYRNVAFTPSEELFSALEEKSKESKVHELFGFSDITHSRVYGSSEEVLELMLRHTFMAPRQLVGLGRAAKDAVNEPPKRPKMVGQILEAIDRESIQLFKDYVAVVSPPWTIELQELSTRLKKNVFSAEEMKFVEKKENYPGFFAQLYSRGLLGVPKHDTYQSKTTQRFHRSTGEEVTFDDSPPYVVLHPALASYIYSNLAAPSDQQLFYSSDFIVGDSLPCPSKYCSPVLTLIYSAEKDAWKLEVNRKGQSLSVGQEANDESSDLSDSDGSDPVDDRERAVTLVIVLIACAMRQKGKPFANLKDIEMIAEDFHKTGMFGGRKIARRELNCFPEHHLKPDSIYMKEAKKMLRRDGVGLVCTSAGEYYFGLSESENQPYQNWPRIDLEDIRIIYPRQRKVVDSAQYQTNLSRSR